MADNTVTLAAVSGAHGVTGEVRLKLFAENLDSLKQYKSFNDGTLTVKSLRSTKDGAIARFAEVNDRNAAEKLRSTLLTVTREALPELDDGEYYYSDLLGLPCQSTDGADLGTCVAVDNFGASNDGLSTGARGEAERRGDRKNCPEHDFPYRADSLGPCPWVRQVMRVRGD